MQTILLHMSNQLPSYRLHDALVNERAEENSFDAAIDISGIRLLWYN